MSESPAAWFPDPFGRHDQRYWDGRSWTEHVDSRGVRSTDAPVASGSTSAIPHTPADWYLDPFGRHERRYFNGIAWTEHVASRGLQGTDPPTDTVSGPPPVLAAPRPPLTTPSSAAAAPTAPWAAAVPTGQQPVRKANKSVERQARNAGVTSGRAGGGTLFTEPVLVVNQKAKLMGSTLSYAVYDQHGHQLGTFREVRRDLSTKMGDKMRGKGDSSRRYRFEVVDMNGHVLLALIRPENWFTSKSEIPVEGPDGAPIGNILQETSGLLGAAASTLHAGVSSASAIAAGGIGGIKGFATGVGLSGINKKVGDATAALKKVGHVRFGLQSGGQRLGSIQAMNSSAWDFTVLDPSGVEIALVTKTWAGWTKERFTKADNYVVRMHRTLEGPVLPLVIASALALDVALKQGDPSRKSSSMGPRKYK